MVVALAWGRPPQATVRAFGRERSSRPCSPAWYVPACAGPPPARLSPLVGPGLRRWRSGHGLGSASRRGFSCLLGRPSLGPIRLCRCEGLAGETFDVAAV